MVAAFSTSQVCLLVMLTLYNILVPVVNGSRTFRAGRFVPGHFVPDVSCPGTFRFPMCHLRKDLALGICITLCFAWNACGPVNESISKLKKLK